MSLPVVPGLIGSLLGWPIKKAAEVGLSVTSNWIVAGAQDILAEVIKVISLVSTPSLTASWFSVNYWHIAGLAMLLTVPFLFAAAVQAVVSTNVGLLLRAAFIDLPIAVLAVFITAPLVELLLAATDEMCAMVTGGGTAGGSFLAGAAVNLSTVHSGFMLVVIAVVILLAGMVLLVELIMRSAAIYIVVLFLPLGFAAMVWPARRVWVKRMVETLVALILSKFAIVAILSLAVTGVASFGAGTSSLTTAFTAMALMVLAAFSPWTLLKLLPFTELALGVGALRQDAHAGIERGRGIASDARKYAAEPVAAGASALGHLVRSGAAAQDGDAGIAGMSLLGRGSRSSSREGEAATPAAVPTPSPMSAPAGESASGPPAMGSSRADGSADSSPVGASAPLPVDASAPIPVGASAPIPVSASAPMPVEASPSMATDAGTAQNAVKPPFADLAPILDARNPGLELNLRGDRSGWVHASGAEAPRDADRAGADVAPALGDGVHGAGR